VNILKVNMLLDAMHCNPCFSESFLWSVVPYLDTNRFRPRLLAIQKTRPFHAESRCWDERFLLLEPIPIEFGCFDQGMTKLLFRRRLQTFVRLLSCYQRRYAYCLSEAQGTSLVPRGIYQITCVHYKTYNIMDATLLQHVIYHLMARR
jgi:hypothetical protein